MAPDLSSHLIFQKCNASHVTFWTQLATSVLVSDGFFHFGFRSDLCAAEDAGLSQPWIEALRNNYLATFAKLSFAVTSPGVVATDEQVTRFLNTLRDGTAATIAELAAFKRLLFESQTLMMHNFKSVAKGDDAAPKRMAPPEREARLERQRQQLCGLDITGPLEPAHSLYDICTSMIEKNEVSYINPNRCLSRQQELMGSKPEKEIQLDATKTSLVVKE